MTRARDDILRRLREARAPKPVPRNLASERARLLPPSFVRTANDLEALFGARLKPAIASVAKIADWSGLPVHVAALLKERSLPATIAIADEPAFRTLDWDGAGLSRAKGLDPMAPGTIVSAASAGVAETGSLLLSTREASRPVHNLFAELHIAALPLSRLVADLESAWGPATQCGVPRGLVYVTGPSRTGDIEMSLELGAHGAVSLHVVLVANG